MPRMSIRGIFAPMEKTFREALLTALTATKRSLRSVAIDAGVSYDLLKNLKQGKSQIPNADDARKVAHAFGVSVDDFYEGRFERPSQEQDPRAWLLDVYEQMPEDRKKQMEDYARYLAERGIPDDEQAS